MLLSRTHSLALLDGAASLRTLACSVHVSVSVLQHCTPLLVLLHPPCSCTAIVLYTVCYALLPWAAGLLSLSITPCLHRCMLSTAR
jgi:hypothetical protein